MRALIEGRCEHDFINDVLVLFDYDACVRQADAIREEWDFESHPFSRICVPMDSNIEVFQEYDGEEMSEWEEGSIHSGSHIFTIPSDLVPPPEEDWKLRGEMLEVYKDSFVISFYNEYSVSYRTPSI